MQFIIKFRGWSITVTSVKDDAAYDLKTRERCYCLTTIDSLKKGRETKRNDTFAIRTDSMEYQVVF